METKNKLAVFFDSVGRTVLGEQVQDKTNDKILTIRNPAVVHITPNPQTGQLTLQILPLFFKEFLADKNASTFWEYKRDLITESQDLVFDFKLQAQYQQLFASAPAPAPTQPQSEPEVIRLFDEE
jgi:hypothetical protein